MRSGLGLYIFKKISPQYDKFAWIVWKNRIRNIFVDRNLEHQFLFILSPPYCGSTLLSQLLETSDSISSNNNFGSREGQTLPTLSKLMFHHSRRYDESLDYDWNFVKKEWFKYWDLRASILLEKSPPNILRAKSIENHFKPSNFIIFTRNPYAHCESLMSRNNWDASRAANFAVRCLRFQKENMLKLKGNKIYLSYEFLTEQTNVAVDRLLAFMPQLQNIDFQNEFGAHNFLSKKMKITNLNNLKFERITEGDLIIINSVFVKNKDTLDFFEYKMFDSYSSLKVFLAE